MPYTSDGAPYVGASDTSKAAAKSLAGKLGRLEHMVLEHIKAQGVRGATDDEIECALQLRHQTASARRRTLVIKGLVVESGRERKTRSGRWASVWAAAEPVQLALPLKEE